MTSTMKVSLGGMFKRTSSSRKLSKKSTKSNTAYSTNDLSALNNSNHQTGGGPGRSQTPALLAYTVGVTQLAGAKDQDRTHTAQQQQQQQQTVNKSLKGTDTVLSSVKGAHGFDIEVLPNADFFAVFDGHGTSTLAADICVSDLLNSVLAQHSKNTEKKTQVGKSGKFEVLPTDEAIINGFHETDEKIRRKAKELNELRTGSCAVCVFIEPLSYFSHLFEHSVHSTTSTSITSRVSSFAELPVTNSLTENDGSPLKSDTNFDVTEIIDEETVSIDSEQLEVKISAKFAWVGDSRAVVFDNHGTALFQTEDHKVSTNTKERDRIEEMMKLSKPRDGILESDFWKNETANVEKTGQKARAKSFIGKRRLPNGVPVGNDVLFAYSNGISLQVSRSLGDPLAARSAICTPEIMSFDLVFSNTKGHDGYRFVLASDGLWDVLSVAQVSKLILKVKDSKFAAEILAKQAQHRRVTEGLVQDDISVVVVDIPDIFKLLGVNRNDNKATDKNVEKLVRYRRSFLNLVKLSKMTLN